MQAHTFLSYARTDRHLAQALAAELRRAGVEVWVDCDNISLGDQWDRAVELALAQSAAILVILTPAAVTSPNVRDEITYALDAGKRVFPLLYESAMSPCASGGCNMSIVLAVTGKALGRSPRRSAMIRGTVIGEPHALMSSRRHGRHNLESHNYRDECSALG